MNTEFNFDDSLHFEGGKTFDYLELKNKGDSLTVRFLGKQVFEGKHFFQQQDGSWDVQDCPRIMSKGECVHCEKYFKAKKGLKQFKDRDTLTPEEQEQKKKLERLADAYKPTINFYWKVLNRDAQEVQILKTSKFIRIKLEEESKAGINIIDFDYVFTRNKQRGSDAGSQDFYSLTRKDSSTIPALTEAEHTSLDENEGMDLNKIIFGARDSHAVAEAKQESDRQQAEVTQPTPLEKAQQEADNEIDVDQIIEEMDGQLPSN